MKKINVLIIAVVFIIVSIFSSVSSVAAAADTDNNMCVVSGLAISENEIVIDNNIYSGFEGFEVGVNYRCSCFTDGDIITEIFDIDTFSDYLLNINSYNHDLSRVDVCRAIDDNNLLDSSDDLWSVYDAGLTANDLYYVFYDKCNTDDCIYDDNIIYIMSIDDFDIEVYELNKMAVAEDINTNTDINDNTDNTTNDIYNLYVNDMLLISDNIDVVNFKSDFINSCFNDVNTNIVRNIDDPFYSIYPACAVVTCIDNNVCYAIDNDKNIWSFYADDLNINDIVAMIIDSNKTITKSDDVIINVRYAGNLDTIRPY